MTCKVSVIIPCRNEEKTIHLLLEALTDQNFSQSEMEVIIADGMSTDQTRPVIQEFKAAHPEMNLQVVDNPKKIIPSALNAGILASNGEVIIRMDAHSIPSPDYITRCVQALDAGIAENVGGVWDITPQNSSWIARAIAAAAAHPLAVGDAQYRYSSQAAYVDTVPFGAFKRELTDKIGFFDETLLTNEDYEFNTRIRQSGGRIWLDPQIRSVYYARKNLKELAQQYWRYGFWKAHMLRRYPETLRFRQALPPLFVLSLVLLPLLGLLYRLFWALFLAELMLYGIVLLSVGIQLAIKNKDFLLVPGVPLAIATMHLSWGASFMVGLFSRSKPKKYQECRE